MTKVVHSHNTWTYMAGEHNNIIWYNTRYNHLFVCLFLPLLNILTQILGMFPRSRINLHAPPQILYLISSELFCFLLYFDFTCCLFKKLARRASRPRVATTHSLFTQLENSIYVEYLDLGKQCDIAGIPLQPTSGNSGRMDVWPQGFEKGFSFCHSGADIPSSDENISYHC